MEQREKILIVDDEKKIVEVLKSYVENAGYKVLAAYNGNDAIDVFKKENPDLIILDLMLPEISGEEVCRIIRKESKVPIIMLTAKVQEDSIINGLDIGADDYVTKPFSPRQIIARIKALLRRTNRESGSGGEVLSYDKGNLAIDCQKYEVKKQGHIISLTPNEFKILLALAKRPQKVFTRDELIIVAFGEDFDGLDRTIDSHIKNLRQKLEDNSRNPEYILTIHGIGYKFGKEELDI